MQSRTSVWSTFWGTGRERKRPEFRANDSKHSRSEPENKSLAASREKRRKIIINSLKNTGSKSMLWTLPSANWFQYKWNKGRLEDQYASKTKRTRANRIKTLYRGREGRREGEISHCLFGGAHFLGNNGSKNGKRSILCTPRIISPLSNAVYVQTSPAPSERGRSLAGTFLAARRYSELQPAAC